MLLETALIGINRGIDRYTYLREEFGHEIIGPADVDGHIVRHVIVVRLGLKQINVCSLIKASLFFRSVAFGDTFSIFLSCMPNIFPLVADSPM